MASIHYEVELSIDAEQAWRRVRVAGDAPKLFAPILTSGEIAGDHRTVRFANGNVVRERILSIDDDRRRLAYTVTDGAGLEFHHASMQIVDAGRGRSRFVWTTDLLPPEARDAVAQLMDAGGRALKTNLEAE